jgi:hypothetical protein
MTSGVGDSADAAVVGRSADGTPSGWATSEDEGWAPVPEGPRADSTSEANTGPPGATTAVASAAELPKPELRPEDGYTRPLRVALGMAVFAAERLSRGRPTSAAFVTGVGLLQQGAAEARTLGRRIMGPPTGIASRGVDRATGAPGSDHPGRSVSRSRQRLSRVVSDAKKRGEASVAAGRADASAFVQASVKDGIAWAQAQVVPQIIDAMLPYFLENVIPRIIDGVMPEIRSRVLPAVIDDLTDDPRLRDLVLEQSKGAVGDATQHLRATTANADDRVEKAFRRRGRGQPQTDDGDASATEPGETPQPPTDEANTRPSDG